MSRASRHKKQSSNIIVGIVTVLIVLIVIVKIFDKGNKNQTTAANKPVKVESTAVIGAENKEQNEDSSKDAKPADNENSGEDTSKASASNESTKSKTANNKTAASNKSAYLEKLKKAEAEDKKQFDNMRKKGGNSEYNSYSFWDEKLNDLYGELKQKLPKERVTVLKNSQVRWINNKDANAKKIAVKRSGKKDEIPNVADMAELTKERCYFLVNNYVKE